ncbi:hypothetical protein CJU90_2183 [Yarrowia sp. C11]|nr:hypothetical protein CKK34_6211 [Yarrowia sp. E02]KAG5372107.1 hypothetical protein CJU90_2183 [Yarrowia sp. C11]
MSLEESWIDVDQKVTVKPPTRYSARMPKVEALDTESSALFYHAPSVYVIESEAEEDDEDNCESRDETAYDRHMLSSHDSRNSPPSRDSSTTTATSIAALQDSLSTIVSRDMKQARVHSRSKAPSSVCLDSLRIVPESQLPKMRARGSGTVAPTVSSTDSDSDSKVALKKRRVKRVRTGVSSPSMELSGASSPGGTGGFSPAALAAGITIIGLSFSAGYAIGRQSLRTASVN